jgi:ankyrin repeat protein
VNLQLKSLCEISAARKDELVDQALYTLPNGLDETYTKIVNLIEEQPEYMKNLALKSLTWILFAKRPLRVDELQHALATDRAYQTKEKLDLDSGEAILEACNNLAVTENGVVRPAHYSVQEFFTSPRSETFQGSLYQNLLDAGLVHQTLASVCIKYIRLGELVAPCKTKWELRDRIVNVAFAHYAARHFDCHIQEARTLPPELIDLLGGLLEQDEVSLASILQFRIIDRGKLQEAIHYDFSPFSFTVSPSLIVYATRLFEVDQIKARWLGETIPPYALHLASRAGVVSAVERLLDLKVDIEKKDEDGMSPIYLAACCGHLEVVELLWRHSADVNAQGGYYGFALQAACAQGHEAVVDTLLAKGADVNAQGGYYGNALQGACSAGHETIVDRLLEKGANVNAQGGFYGNALQAAHSQGYKTIAEKLLAQGANADVQSG